MGSLEPRVDIDYPGGAGCCGVPTLTDHGDGSVTVGAIKAFLYDHADGSGVPVCWAIVGATFALTDQTTNYVVVDRFAGTADLVPAYKVITDVSLINETTVIPAYTIVRTGTSLHIIPWDSLGYALVNKLHQSVVKTQRYRRESGLALSEYGTRNLLLTAGIVWTGAVKHSLLALDTATDRLRRVYHVAGQWTVDTTPTQYDNNSYDNGTNLVTLTANRYAVQWVYRGVEDNKHLYVTYGIGDYTLAQAQEAVAPAPPFIISSHAALVAKIIVQKGASTATAIQSAFDTQFATAVPNSHEDLAGLQGGGTGEHYHFTAAQHAALLALIGG